MNETPNHPSAKELAELEAYLAARQRREEPLPGKPGFPTGTAGELLELAQQTHPDPVFAARLEQRLRWAAQAASQTEAERTISGQLRALWQTISHPERQPVMKHLNTLALAGMLFLAILFMFLIVRDVRPIPTQVAIATPPVQTPEPGSVIPGAQTPISPTLEPKPTLPAAAINFTPRPIPAQPPALPSLAQVYGQGYGGGGGGNLPAGMPISLAVELPAGPAEAPAYYRQENTPLTLDEASQLAARWGLDAQLYVPLWMQMHSDDQLERSYYAVDGMKILSLWNGSLSYSDLAIFPNYEGHQYPQTGLLPVEQALASATQYLSEHGFLTYPYQADLSGYDYGTINFYRLLDGVRIDSHAASVKLNPQGQVGSMWINREDYQAVGTYPILSAQAAWENLIAGEPSERLRISSYPVLDGNPQYWGRTYPAGETAHLFGRPVLLPAVDAGLAPYIQLNNLILAGDIYGLAESLQSNGGYIHAWGKVQEQDGVRLLLLSGWELFDEFNGYFDGIVRRTVDGDFLELSDGRRLSLPGLQADVLADIPLYAQGGVVDNTLEWFILQVHPASEGQMPPDLSQAAVVIEHVELVYLAPELGSLPPEQALDAAYRMLQPAWLFSGRITTPAGVEMIYRGYVQAGVNP